MRKLRVVVICDVFVICDGFVVCDGFVICPNLRSLREVVVVYMHPLERSLGEIVLIIICT